LATLTLPPIPKLERIGDAALLRIREQARVQVRGRNEGIVYELVKPIEELRGPAALPLPSPGDVFLDFEAVPYAFDTGLEYLIGTALVPEQPSAGRFRPFPLEVRATRLARGPATRCRGCHRSGLAAA
jgi:uncharacterized protein